MKKPILAVFDFDDLSLLFYSDTQEPIVDMWWWHPYKVESGFFWHPMKATEISIPSVEDHLTDYLRLGAPQQGRLEDALSAFRDSVAIHDVAFLRHLLKTVEI